MTASDSYTNPRAMLRGLRSSSPAALLISATERPALYRATGSHSSFVGDRARRAGRRPVSGQDGLGRVDAGRRQARDLGAAAAAMCGMPWSEMNSGRPAAVPGGKPSPLIAARFGMHNGAVDDLRRTLRLESIDPTQLELLVELPDLTIPVLPVPRSRSSYGNGCGSWCRTPATGRSCSVRLTNRSVTVSSRTHSRMSVGGTGYRAPSTDLAPWT
jgi:hypothetical protein